MISTKKWILWIGILLLFSVFGCIFLALRSPAGSIATVYQDGVLIYSVDLDTITEPTTIPVTSEDGYNLICIEPGRIRIEDADCPDQICVKAGWLKNSAAPIVCLPHKLVIQLEDAEASSAPAIDAVVK